ncbi:MAG TPA: hypothetical protein DDY71_05605 [Spirochaetia bacterium]|nr:hypothetical protein [Spirochaetia bacterium]
MNNKDSIKIQYSFEPYFRWYDLWVGIYINIPKDKLKLAPSGWEIYVGLFPMFGIKITKHVIYFEGRKTL